MILAVLLGILPGFVWLMFYLQEDEHPEPKRMIAKVFFAGVFMTVVIVILQFLFQELSKWIIIPRQDFVSIAVFAGIEEVFKFLAAYWVIRRSKFFDEPVDAMIYMIVAALGVATVENVLIAINIMQTGLNEVFNTITLRFLGATLLHALSSGTVGYAWAVGMMRKRVGLWVLFGLINAIALHSVFNYFIMIFDRQILIYPTLFLIVAAFFIFYDFEKLKNPTNYE